jgi:hypothetical protein
MFILYCIRGAILLSYTLFKDVLKTSFKENAITPEFDIKQGHQDRGITIAISLVYNVIYSLTNYIHCELIHMTIWLKTKLMPMILEQKSTLIE